jgi:hypothetical protein
MEIQFCLINYQHDFLQVITHVIILRSQISFLLNSFISYHENDNLVIYQFEFWILSNKMTNKTNTTLSEQF